MGYGWCLQFEKVLIKQTDGSIDLFSCSSDRPVRFRFSYQNRNDYIYKSGKNPAYTLVQHGQQMIVTDPEHNRWVFDSGGLLRRWLLRHHQKFHLLRSRDGTPETLVGPFGKVRLRINRDNGLLERMQWNQKTISFAFQNLLLTSVKTPTTLWNYEYDLSRNLTRITKNGITLKTIAYNISNDQVQQLIEASYILKLNSAGQIISMDHPEKGKVTFHYNKDGSIARLYWKQKSFTLSELNGSLKGDPKQTQIVEYLFVASRAIKSLKSL